MTIPFYDALLMLTLGFAGGWAFFHWSNDRRR